MAAVKSTPEDKSGYEPRYMKVIREQYRTHCVTPETCAEIKAAYYGMTSRLDGQFGRFITKLDSLGRWEETVSLFFTDHGEYLGDHGLIEKSPSGLSKTPIHEPLIIGGGGLPQGIVMDVMAEMVDLIPTVFELWEIGEHLPHNGESLVPVLIDGMSEYKDYAFSEGGFLISEEPLLEPAPSPYDIKAGLEHEDTALVGNAISILSKTWTYAYPLYEPADLCHSVDDPEEMHNLAHDPEHVGVSRTLENEFSGWFVGGSDFLPWRKDSQFSQGRVEIPKGTIARALGAGGSKNERPS